MRVSLWRLVRAKPVDRFPDGDKVLDGWVPTHPVLDLFAMMTSLSHAQAQLARAFVVLARMLSVLATLWAILAMMWAWPAIVAVYEMVAHYRSGG
jgi:hypothetical protein